MTNLSVVDVRRRLPVAVGSAGEKTASDLLRLAHNLASQLPSSPNAQQVAVLCLDRYYFAAAVLGVWLAGHTVALPPNDKPAMLASIQATQSLLAVWGDGQNSADVDVRNCAELRADAPPFAAFPAARLAARVYSSGTTGSPVAYEKTFAQLLGEAEVLANLLGLLGATVLPTVAAQHIYGFLVGVLAPLISGGAFVRETPLYPGHILEAAAAVKATVLVSVPAHLKGLAVRAAEAPLSEFSVRRIVSSGAPLPRETGESLKQQLGVQVVELFGSTETGGIAQRSPGALDWAPLPGVQITTARALGRSDFFEDQLFVQSVFTGHTGWFATGDRVELSKGGTFLHKSRSDRVGKVGGKRVDLGALEHLLAAVPGVEEVAVLGLRAPPPRDVELVSVLVAPGVSIESLREALLQVFDPVAVPRRWRFVQQLPRQALGKVARAELEALFDPNTEAPVLGVTCETRTCLASKEGSAFTFSIFAPKQAWFFRGHFEGDPLMPAVVQINDVVLPHIARSFGNLGSLRHAQRLKFKRPIRPGELLTLELQRPNAEMMVHFELLAGEHKCSSGTLLFGDLGV
ncbi:MAG: AMP-binding protein [Polyangiaceae bacterium]|nr:AMP-binding protein [Polyangiaceae bacterium]